MLNSIDHLIIAVHDLQQATEEYSMLLGRNASWQGRHPDMGSSNTIFRLANTYLELVSVSGEGSFAELIAQHLESKGQGLMGVAFGCSNIDISKRALLAQNIAVGDIQHASATSDDLEIQRHWRMALIDPASMKGLFSFLIEPQDTLALSYSTLREDCSGRDAIDAVDHLVVDTNDADDFIQRYSKQLGLKLLLDQTIEKWGVRQLFFRLGGVTLEVICKQNKEGDAGNGDSNQVDTLWGLAFKVPDITKVHTRLSQHNIKVSDVRIGRGKGTAVATPKTHTLGIPTILIGPDTLSEPS